MIKNALIGAGALALLILTFCIGRYSVRPEEPVVRIDTVTRYDTVRVETPREVVRYVTRIDTLLYKVSETDTVTVHVPIPIEKKEYKTDTYYAVVEGYKPALTHIETYNKVQYIDRVETHTIKDKNRWGLGVNAGYGYNFGENKFSPYIGVGLQYNLITW